MITRLMYKPHITCLSKDIIIQSGKTLTTDTLINKTLTNGSEVYCIDTSECYLYDEENKTLIKTKFNDDILIDGEITPESVNIINTKVDNFINDVNERIERAGIDKIVELGKKMDSIETTIGSEEMGTTAETIKGAIGEHSMCLNESVKKSNSDITYYVNTNTGSDSNNGLASDTAFKTIQHAIDILPQFINNNITINIADGAYNEHVKIYGFGGKSKLNIIGNTITPTNCIIDGFDIQNNSIAIQISGFKDGELTKTKIINILRSIYVGVDKCIFNTVDSLGYGLIASCSNVLISNSELSNKYAAISGYLNALITSSNNSGTNNTTGLLSNNNSSIAKDGTQPTGTEAEKMSTGGIIR